ncbi:class F sortase [Actinacidiphila alni]|uniref:class F sortase n=1 Tax=Actinacidiphila alni TaxID=380248 RepID=UPI000A782343|nr:class F sortase [Actinacidiphila alni]
MAPTTEAARTRAARTAAAVRGGCVLAVAALTLLCGCSTGPAARPTPGSASSAVATSAPASPRTTSPVRGTTPATGAARPLARSVPQRLRIPAIGVDTPVMSLGLNSDGTVAVPPIQAHSPAGWYKGSPTPGVTGPSVILGHVTVGQYGDGVFLHLAKLVPGDRIEIGLKDGAQGTFTVDSVQTVAKSRFPTDKVYGNVDHPALRLITCGGTRITGSGYADNVIVYASLSSGAGP